VAETGFERLAGGGDGDGWVGDQRAEAEGGDLAGGVSEWDAGQADIGRVGHFVVTLAVCSGFSVGFERWMSWSGEGCQVCLMGVRCAAEIEERFPGYAKKRRPFGRNDRLSAGLEKTPAGCRRYQVNTGGDL
jgi:hypothetical protein